MTMVQVFATPTNASIAERRSAAAKTGSVGIGEIRFRITGAARPGAGHHLASYTLAWLVLSGMYEGMGIPKGLAIKLGGRAVSYHLQPDQGNFEERSGLVYLTLAGQDHFLPGGSARRKIQAVREWAEAYADAMQHGIPNEVVKNAAFIARI